MWREGGLFYGRILLSAESLQHFIKSHADKLLLLVLQPVVLLPQKKRLLST